MIERLMYYEIRKVVQYVLFWDEHPNLYEKSLLIKKIFLSQI